MIPGLLSSSFDLVEAKAGDLLGSTHVIDLGITMGVIRLR